MSLSLSLTLFFTEGVSLQSWQQVGGLERELAIYRALQARGANIRLVTYGDRADLDLADHLLDMSLIVNRFKLSRHWYQQYVRWTLPKMHREIYKSNQIPGAQLPLQAARRNGAAFIARCGYWWADFAEHLQGPDSVAAREARTTEAEVFPNADAVVVTADWIREGVIERYNLDPSQVRVIPNYVQTDLFAPAPQPTSISGPFQVIYVGRLAPEKNLPALIEAIAPLDVELAIIGEGPDRQRLETLVDSLSATVRFLGRVPNAELPGLLNRSQAFVLPSLQEGQPKALQEAMACGLPVIGCDVVGVRALIEHESTGLLSDASAEGLREAVRRMMDDAHLRQRIGAAAHQYVLDHFALDKVVEQEIALYKELLA